MTSTAPMRMEYDPFSPAFQADPFPVYRWMRDEAPVFYSEKWNWWALSRFDDVRAAALDPATTCRSRASTSTTRPRTRAARLPAQRRQPPPRPDPRRRAAAACCRGRIDERADIVPRHGARADRRLARTAAPSTSPQELAWPMPNEVFFDLLGLPERGPDRAPAGALGARAQGPQARRRPAHPGGQGGHRGHPVLLRRPAERAPPQPARGPRHATWSTPRSTGCRSPTSTSTHASEIMGLMLVLFLGGVESTAGLIGTLFKLLAENPDQRAILRGGPRADPRRRRGGHPHRHAAAARRAHHLARGHAARRDDPGGRARRAGLRRRQPRRAPLRRSRPLRRHPRQAAPPRLRRGHARLHRRAAGPAGGQDRAGGGAAAHGRLHHHRRARALPHHAQHVRVGAPAPGVPGYRDPRHRDPRGHVETAQATTPTRPWSPASWRPRSGSRPRRSGPRASSR